MTWWTRLFRRTQLEDELDAELRDHLGHQTDEYRRHGIDAAEAHRRARADLGQVDGVKDDCRQAWGLRLFDELRSDLQFGLRGLARTPGFTAAAALTLSIGIGGTAAMFTVANVYLFRPFPAPNPEQLVVVAQRDEHTTAPHKLSYSEYLDYRDLNEVFEGLAAYANYTEILSVAGGPGPVVVDYVSRDFFEVLRVDAALGRTFLPEEGQQPGDAAVVVLSHRTWQNRFGANPLVVGTVVRLGATAQTVIGVTPESFGFTDNTGIVPELYAPIPQFALVGRDRGDPLTDRTQERFFLIGRLKSDVTVAEARANLRALTTALAIDHPVSMEHSELWIEAERHARPFPAAARFMVPGLTTVMAMASLVLLIACANVATLLIGRGLGRQREMALRAGLGATRLRLIRQLISESALLTLLGGAGGALVALLATDLISAFAPAFPGATVPDLPMDWRVFAFTAAAATLTGLITGFAPALQGTRVDLTGAIGTGGRGAGGGPAGQRLTSGLVVVQVTMSLVLLVCAGLFVRSGQNAVALDLGFRTDELLLVSVDPLAQGYTPDQTRALYRDLADEVAALPGVRSASWATWAPHAIRPPLQLVTLDGGAIPETDPASLVMNRVDPAFFDTVDVPVIRGRGFRDEDATYGQLVALVNETAARQLWPDQDPLGKCFFPPIAPERPFQVIGVVRDAYLSLDTSRVPSVVLWPFSGNGPATLHVYTEGTPTALTSAVTEAMRRRDPTLAVFGVTSMDRHVYDGPVLAGARLGAWVTGAFGALGLILAAVGLYGVVAYSVTKRRQEFAIRTALGATPAGIVRLALGRGMILTGLGLALGFLAAAGVTPFTAGFLVNINPTDPVVFGVTGLLLAGVALLACLVPSRGAARAEPLVPLNTD